MTSTQAAQELPQWVDIVVKITPALVALAIGLLAFVIQYRQYKISHDKLRLDLFAKRLEAFEKLQEFFMNVMRHGRVADEAFPILLDARSKSRFLFGSEIDAYFETLWKKAAHMHELNSRIYGPDGLSVMPVGSERTAICQELGGLVKEMMEEMTSSSKRYARYLQFK